MILSFVIAKYDMAWQDGTDDLNIEFHMIRCGGYVTDINGRHGHGLFYHFKEAQKLLWPTDDHHRWSDDILKLILGERISVVGGARDSSKTYTVCRYALTDYWLYPEETLIIMSSTHSQGLQLRLWGTLKDLFTRAKEGRPWLAGNTVESKYGIFTDKLEFGGTIRDQRKGIICVPVVGGEGEWLSGLEKFIGVKQKRRRLLGDEVQFCDPAYLNVMANLDKGDFKGVFCGNFLGNGDTLDRLAEPVGGWSSLPEPTKTTTWENRLGGRTLNLVGLDSPNFDVPEGQPIPYPYLIDREDAKRVARRYGEDSLQYWSQIRGIRKADLMAHRILTMDICRKYGAFQECTWEGSPRTKVYGLDAAFGGDRAVGGMVEFGREVGGREVIKFHKPREIHFNLSDSKTIEEQLAWAVRDDCVAFGIPPENCFFDAGMRASLAVQIGKVFSTSVNALNFGGPVSQRPVSKDDYIIDPKTNQRRLKRCDEAYVKFVTELAWSVRMAVEAGQIREIGEDIVREFEMREWTQAPGDKIELETKSETKKRAGKSPDLADWAEICLEGCRQRGFVIEGLKDPSVVEGDEMKWLHNALAKFKKFERRSELKYS